MKRISLLVAVVLAGCAAPPLHRYLLGGPPAAAPPAAAVEVLPARMVELRPVLVPDHLDTHEILREGADGELVASPRGRWADRLSVGIRQALAADLQRRLPQDAIPAIPLPQPDRRRVSLTVTRFDLSAGGALTLEADWLVEGTRPGAVLAARRARFVATGVAAGDAAQTAAMGALLDQLAAAIARDL